MVKHIGNTSDAMQNLLDIMAQLRDPDGGCPWDLKQDFRSILPHTLEEAYEVADAIESDDRVQLRDELGDLLFQVVFYCQLAREEGSFEFADVAQTMADKLIRRHPHVFGPKPMMRSKALWAWTQSKYWNDGKALNRVSVMQSSSILYWMMCLMHYRLCNGVQSCRSARLM